MNFGLDTGREVLDHVGEAVLNAALAVHFQRRGVCLFECSQQAPVCRAV
jgi:hypothetical protein